MCGSRRPNRFRFGPCNMRISMSVPARGAPALLPPPLDVASATLLRRAYRRNDGDHLLLATRHLDDEALAIEIAVLVERDIEKHARIVLRGDLRAMQRFRQCLGIDLPNLFRHRLDHVD